MTVPAIDRTILYRKQYTTAWPDHVTVTLGGVAFSPDKPAWIEAKEKVLIASSQFKLETGPALVTATERELVIQPK